MNIDQRQELHRSGERSFDLTEIEFRDDNDDAVTFEGVASVVDKPYTVRDQFGEFTETIAAGAFNKTLRDSKADVALFVNHQTSAIPLATRSSGSLQLRATPDLSVVATMNPRRHDVQDVREAVKDKILPQMSIGFQVPRNRDTWNDDWTERTIHEVRLAETSIVWQGANHLTTAAVRSLDELLEELPDDIGPAELRRAMAVLAQRASVPLDESIASLAQALDASIDEALDDLTAGDVDTALALLTSADVTADALMAALGLSDPDEMDDESSMMDDSQLNAAPLSVDLIRAMETLWDKRQVA